MEEIEFNLIKDPEYGYMRVDPIPSDEYLDEYYAGGFYEDLNIFRESSIETQEAQKEFFNWRWEDIHRVLEKYFADKRSGQPLSIFDVGCGFAQVLLYFRERGFDVAGLEPSPAAVEYAAGVGLDVRRGMVDDVRHLERRYDAVFVLDVLEHLPRPAEALGLIKDHALADDGLLVMHVANDFNPFQTTADELYDLRQWWVAPPRHLNYFTVDSLIGFVEKCGFEVHYCETSFPLELFLLFGDVYVGDYGKGSECHERRVNFERALRNSGRSDFLHKFYEKLAEIGVGREIEIFCRPKK